MALWIRSLPLLVLLAVLAPTTICAPPENGQHLCGSALVDAYIFVCGKQDIYSFPKRNIEQPLEHELLDNEVPFHLVKRGIVEDCCDNICSLSVLQSYCK